MGEVRLTQDEAQAVRDALTTFVSLDDVDPAELDGSASDPINRAIDALGRAEEIMDRALGSRSSDFEGERAFAVVRRVDGSDERDIQWQTFSATWEEAFARLKAVTFDAVQDHWQVRPGGDGLSILCRSNPDLVDVSDRPWGRWHVEAVDPADMPERVRRVLGGL